MTTMGRAWAVVLIALLAGCSSAGAVDDRGVPPEPTGPDLPPSETLAAGATERAAALCDDGGDGIRSDPAAYHQETWAEVSELVGRARLDAGIADADDRRAAALAEVRRGWQGDPALIRSGWDHAETAEVECGDGFLYAVDVRARAPRRADAGAFRRPRHPAGTIRQRAGVRYGTAPDVDGRPVDLLLDLFSPPRQADDDAAGRPLIVLVHGGGFTAGSRTQHADDAVAWARRGFVVATIDYRVDPDAGDSTTAHRAASYAAIDDAMEAVRWLRANANELGVDPDRIAALGQSAGGEIALALALLEDLTPDGPREHVSLRVDAAFSTGAYLTPVLGAARLDETDSPVLLHHFETDTESRRSWTYAAATCDAVRAAGGTCDVDVSPGEDHVVGIGPDSPEIDRILAFLAVHLRLDG